MLHVHHTQSRSTVIPFSLWQWSSQYSLLILLLKWFTDYSYLGLFVPSLDFSYPRLFVPWTIRTMTGRFVPCWERRHSLYSVSQKIPVQVFWHFSLNGREFLVQILHAYYTLIPTVDNKFLFNYLQISQTYAILSATTQRAFRPMVDILSIWWWSGVNMA